VIEPEEGRVEAVIEYLWALPRGETNFVTMIIPELMRRSSLVSEASHRTELSLKFRLLREPGVVIADVPVLAQDADWPPPKRAVCRILVSGAHAASMRAAIYAQTLGIADTRAVSFAFDAEEAERLRADWRARRMPIPLEIEEAPYRDIGDPLVRHLRAITADPEAVAVTILPEVIFSGASRMLHNQRALYIKRLLLFEPRVILSSVPYRLD